MSSTDTTNYLEQLAYKQGVAINLWQFLFSETFLLPYLSSSSVTLQLGYDSGLWRQISLPCAQLHVADWAHNFSGVDSSRKENQTPDPDRAKTFYHALTSPELTFAENNSVDFVWSFSFFDHINPNECALYLREITRILKPNAHAILLHPDNPDQNRIIRRLLNIFTPEKETITSSSSERTKEITRLTKEFVRQCAESQGLSLEAQVDSWGKYKQFSFKKSKRTLSIFSKRDSKDNVAYLLTR